jgi:NitT/TauT family transport system substrate-binding protein
VSGTWTSSPSRPAVAACGDDGENGSTPEPTDAGTVGEETGEATGEATGAPTEQDLYEMTVAHLPIAAKVQVVVAQEEGLLAENGIDATFELFRGDAEALPAMIAGEVDGGGINIATMISAYAEGFDLGCFSGGQVTPPEGDDTGNILVAADSDITSLADLEGGTLAVNNIGSLMWVFVQALLTQEGVDPATVDYVEVPFPNMGDVLQAGQADAVALVEPFNTVLVNEGVAEVLSPLYMPVLPGVELDCLVFRWSCTGRTRRSCAVSSVHTRRASGSWSPTSSS